MLDKHSFKTVILILLGILMVAVVACTPSPGAEPGASESLTATPAPTTSPDGPVSSTDPTPTDEPAPDGDEEVIIKDAVVTSVEIVMMESWPLQASALVKGELGDGCTELGAVETERQGNTFHITIKTTRPAEAVCTMILQFFEETIPLDIAGLEAGTYVVNVNGVEKSFTLEQDNVANPDEGAVDETPATSVELNEEDRVELVRLTLERALIQEEIPDYNLLMEQGSVVLSTENIDGNVVPELDGVELTLLTPDEIQARANEQGDFLYLHFTEIQAESKDKVTVSLNNSWATAEDSDKGYLSGGGFSIEYTREEEGWVGEITSAWIS